MSHKILTKEFINPNVIKAQYAVRGAVPMRAEELARELKLPNSKLPFDEIVFLNIGNPQQLKQKPITFFRQVVALTEYPELIEKASNLFKPDAINRAKEILNSCGGSVGAYTSTGGIYSIRENVANAISERDGFKCDTEQVFLTAGASQGVHLVFELLVTDSSDGVMIPIPQYPLYSAAIALRGGTLVPYFPDESKDWTVTKEILEKSFESAKKQNVKVKAICVINPGNPTGSVLDLEAMQTILRFCKNNGIILIADEVYQENIYEGSWFSFRKVLHDLEINEPNIDWKNQELISLHTISKGLTGECGKRGGYIQLTNLDSYAIEMIRKKLSIDLCSPVSGQVVVDCMMNPPKPGDASYDEYNQEIKELFESLNSRATQFYEAFNQMKYVTCQKPRGALYIFPRIDFPEGFKKAAESNNMSVDLFYCMELLEASGICLVPGSGFGFREGIFNIRSTILQGDKEFLKRFIQVHNLLIEKYE